MLSDQFTLSISLPSFVLSRGGPDLSLSPVAEIPSAGPAKVVGGHSSASSTSRNDSIKEASDVEVVRATTTKNGGESESVRTGVDRTSGLGRCVNHSGIVIRDFL